MTEDELRTIVAVGHEKGVIETDEKNMINNVFDLDDSVAGDIMVPRVNMTFIDIDANYEELMEISGDKGGKKIIKKHPEDVAYLQIRNARELQDADEPDVFTAGNLR